MTILNSAEFANTQEMDKALTEATEGGKQAVLIVGDHEYLVCDAETAKQQLASKLARHIIENPAFLDDITSRLQNDVPKKY